MEDINERAFQLIQLITKRKLRKDVSKPIGSEEHIERVDLSHVLFPNVPYKVYDADLNKDVGHYYDIDNEYQIGLDEKSYPIFWELVKQLASLEQFRDILSTEFIEKHCFQWLMDCYLGAKAKTYLTDYIEHIGADKIKEFEFRFPITNLTIETPFEVGNVLFTVFTKDEMDKMYKLYQTFPKPLSEQQFNKRLRTPYQSHVHAYLSVNAEEMKAEETALNEISRAVDVLKLFDRVMVYPACTSMFEANFKLNYSPKIEWLSKEKSELGHRHCFKNRNNVSSFF